MAKAKRSAKQTADAGARAKRPARSQAVRQAKTALTAAAADRGTPAADPLVYYDKPLETWTFRELHDALGTARTAEILKTTAGNVRMLRHRGTATLERMQSLQNAVRANEQDCRNALVTIYASGAFRRRAG